MRLSINIDHVATLRNARGGTVPDPAEAARIAEDAGADGIVCHLREDRRHIRDDDVKKLRKTVTTKLDLEMAAVPDIIKVALRIKPDLVTLVPEKRRELTTEGGLDIIRLSSHIGKVIRDFHDSGIAVSLFIDPGRKEIELSKEIGADMIELHTGEYADARTRGARKKHLDRVRRMAIFGKNLGLVINAGHGLDYGNVGPVATVKEIEELSIGHAVIVRSLFVGFGRAVKEMIGLVKS